MRVSIVMLSVCARVRLTEKEKNINMYMCTYSCVGIYVNYESMTYAIAVAPSRYRLEKRYLSRLCARSVFFPFRQ